MHLQWTVSTHRVVKDDRFPKEGGRRPLKLLLDKSLHRNTFYNDIGQGKSYGNKAFVKQITKPYRLINPIRFWKASGISPLKRLAFRDLKYKERLSSEEIIAKEIKF